MIRAAVWKHTTVWWAACLVDEGQMTGQIQWALTQPEAFAAAQRLVGGEHVVPE